jgi:hypothetical protein
MANKIVTLLINDKGDFLKKISEYELKEIMDKNGVPFFPGVYDAPHDIWDVIEREEETYPDAKDKNRFGASDLKRFQQLIRRKNINKQNMVVVNKDRIAKAADILEVGEICSITGIKEVQRFMAKLKRLNLIAESYNDKLSRVEYYINPCYHKPGSRLGVELYGMFRIYLWEAMTVKVSKYFSIKGKKNIKEGDVTTNTYRNMIEQAYQQQRVSTVKDEDAMRIVEEVRISVAEEKLEAAQNEIRDFGIGVDDIIAEVMPMNEDDLEMLNECAETVREIFGAEVIIKEGLKQSDFWTIKSALDEYVQNQDIAIANELSQGLLVINA